MTDMNTKVYRVAVCDDHLVIRHALKGILQKSSNCIVVAEAVNHESTLQILQQNEIDIIFLDISWPGVSGVETINQVRQKYPNIKIIVFSMHDEESMILKCMLSGADAYLTKDASIKDILEVINFVTEDKLYLQNKLEYLRETLEKHIKSKRKDCTSIHPLDKLSKREREVFFMLSEGQANRYIAKKMFLSPRTVETHRARILKKLTLNTTVDLVRFAIKNNLLSI